MPTIKTIDDRAWMGLDPGADGAVVVLWKGGTASYRTPDTQLEMLRTLKRIRNEYTNLFCVVEKVGGYIHGLGTGPSMFNFGMNYGGWLMALTAAEIPFEAITPPVWMKEFSMKRGKGESRRDWKHRLKGVAERLFPGRRITLSDADAYLLAEYCKRTFPAF